MVASALKVFTAESEEFTPTEAASLKSCAERVRHAKSSAVENFMAMAAAIAEAHALFANKGNGRFGQWVESCCGMTDRQARNLLTVHRKYGDAEIDFRNFDCGSLLLLASDDVGDDLREKIITAGNAGTPISQATVKGALKILDAAPTPASGERAVDALLTKAASGARISHRVVDTVAVENGVEWIDDDGNSTRKSERIEVHEQVTDVLCSVGRLIPKIPTEHRERFAQLLREKADEVAPLTNSQHADPEPDVPMPQSSRAHVVVHSNAAINALKQIRDNDQNRVRGYQIAADFIRRKCPEALEPHEAFGEFDGDAADQLFADIRNRVRDLIAECHSRLTPSARKNLSRMSLYHRVKHPSAAPKYVRHGIDAILAACLHAINKSVHASEVAPCRADRKECDIPDDAIVGSVMTCPTCGQTWPEGKPFYDETTTPVADPLYAKIATAVREMVDECSGKLTDKQREKVMQFSAYTAIQRTDYPADYPQPLKQCIRKSFAAILQSMMDIAKRDVEPKPQPITNPKRVAEDPAIYAHDGPSCGE